MTLAHLIQTMTVQGLHIITKPGIWTPLWMLCAVVKVNKKYVISNTPY